MDLSKLIGKEDGRLFLTHPVTGEELKDDAGNPLYIDLASADSDFFRKAQADITRKTQGKRNKKLTPEAIDDAVNEQLAAVTLGWSDNVEFKGQPLKFTRENACELYDNVRWIREQVADYVYERSNFLSKS